MTAFDDLLLANARLQRSTSAALATKDFASSVAKWATDIELRLAPPTPPAVYLFDGDPNRTGNLSPWDWFNTGASPTSTAVASKPQGGTTPGAVQVVTDPLGERGKVYALTATATAHASPAQGTDSVYLWNSSHDYGGKFGVPGVTNTIRFGTLFASGSFVPEPPIGGITWLVECHELGINAPWSSLALGIVTDHTVDGGSVKPQLCLRCAGGDTRTPKQPTYLFTRKPLPIGWADHKIDIYWDVTASGAVAWNVTGSQTFSASYSGPTLWTNGTSLDLPNFELVNYRPSMAQPSTVHFSRATIS